MITIMTWNLISCHINRWAKRQHWSVLSPFRGGLTRAIAPSDMKTKACDSKSAICSRGGKVSGVTSCFYSTSAASQKAPSLSSAQALPITSPSEERGVARGERTEDRRESDGGIKQRQQERWDISAGKMAVDEQRIPGRLSSVNTDGRKNGGSSGSLTKNTSRGLNEENLFSFSK